MLHKLPFRAMGCEILAILEHDSESPPTVLGYVPDWFEEWEQTFSRFRPDSELSRLNQTFDQPIEVSATLWDVFQYALSAELMTNGLVTPTVMDAMLSAGYDVPFDSLRLDQDSSPPSVFQQVDPLSLVIWDESSRKIWLPRGVRLDFGGVAKGWAAHQVVRRLKPYGPVLVNAGGDIAISGPRLGNSAWSIGVSKPFEKGTDLEVLYVKRGGVASSGKDRRRWMRGEALHHHIINPRTGQPAVSDLLRVTVVAPTVMEAEAAAKAVFILGSEQGLAWLEENPTLAGVLILDNGNIVHSQRVKAYL